MSSSQGKLFINGQWVEGLGEAFFSVDPSNDKKIWHGKEASATQINQAIFAANTIFPVWANLGFEKRLAYLEQYQEIVKREANRLAFALSEEMGKPLWEAKQEIDSVINKVPISVQAFQDRCKSLEKRSDTGKSWTQHKPHGVVAVLGPFNFPAHLPNGHFVPALLAGNTIVLKPSELTPRMAELLVSCLEEAEFPVGVVNLIQGKGKVGEMLSMHPGLNGLFFTGSYAVGQKLNEHFAKHPGKILALEMGGNNPLIVHEVSDLAAAQYYTLQSAYMTSGQRCTCARRLIITQGEWTEPFIEGLMDQIAKIRVGHFSAQPEPFMGPMISVNAANKIETSYKMLIEQGAKALVPLKREGVCNTFVHPTLIDVTNLTKSYDDELFGPVLQLIRVDHFEQALQEANRTHYGLSAGLLSDHRKNFNTFLDTIRAGAVSWNRPTTGASSQLPFGGIGNSGNFRPSAYYAADYAAYPMAIMEESTLALPKTQSPGLDVS